MATSERMGDGGPASDRDVDFAAHFRKTAEAHQLQAASYRAHAEAYRLECDCERAGFYESNAALYDGFAESYLQMAGRLDTTISNVEGDRK